MTSIDKNIIMVFGTFDIFHKGHENFLKQAREYGNYLMAVIARDKTVEQIKNKSPRDNETARLKAVEQSGLADEVILGSLTDKYEAIKKYKPNIICLGYDQTAFTDKLEYKLKEFKLNTKIIRLKSYFPNIYKSSKISGMNENNNLPIKIELKKFGSTLISRPDGREAFLIIQSLLKNIQEHKIIEVDFSGVQVLTPGWADEVITKLAENFNNIKLINTDNPTVKATLKTLKDYSGLKI